MPYSRIQYRSSNPAEASIQAVEQPKSSGVDDVFLLTIPQVGRKLGLSRTQIYRLVSAGSLPVLKFGAAARIPLSAVRELIAQKVVAQSVPAV